MEAFSNEHVCGVGPRVVLKQTHSGGASIYSAGYTGISSWYFPSTRGYNKQILNTMTWKETATVVTSVLLFNGGGSCCPHLCTLGKRN